MWADRKKYHKAIDCLINQRYSNEAICSIKMILDVEEEFPGLIQSELFDFIEILADSARTGKYSLNNWLEPNGRKCDRKTNYESITRHVEQAKLDRDEKDKDSGRPPSLHAACRLMMDNVRISRGIKHEDDK